MQIDWQGVFPAVCTQFGREQNLDLEETMLHLEHQIEAGIHGVVMLGTLGENASLDIDEKLDVLRATVASVHGRIPVLTGVAETSTAGACRFAEAAAQIGVDGLMVLPGLLYAADRRETLAHFRQVAAATDLPIMIYNNPVSYHVDVTPEMLAELADEPKFVAIKESTDDIRRVTDVINAVGDRYKIFLGVDDLALEGFLLGAVGWVAGMVNAFPRETVRLYELAMGGEWEKAREIYRWFMPTLHLDTHVKLVQYIKLASAEMGYGTEFVRAPRLAIEGAERERVLGIIRRTIDTRPSV